MESVKMEESPDNNPKHSPLKFLCYVHKGGRLSDYSNAVFRDLRSQSNNRTRYKNKVPSLHFPGRERLEERSKVVTSDLSLFVLATQSSIGYHYASM